MLHLSLALPLLRDPRAFQLVAGRDHLMVLDVVAAQAFQMVCDLFSRGCLGRHWFTFTIRRIVVGTNWRTYSLEPADGFGFAAA